MLLFDLFYLQSKARKEEREGRKNVSCVEEGEGGVFSASAPAAHDARAPSNFQT